MKSTLLSIFFLLTTVVAVAQENQNTYLNMADNLLASQSKLTIGGYGEVHYNQPFDNDLRHNGKLDVHRMVMLFGYNFSDKVQFVTELEFEHVSEVYVEQAFLQYKLNQLVQFRAGLLLIPMGIINEYHEPTTFNGVERPLIDGKIAPTTWREIGFGITGNYLPLSIKYQLYVVNGFNGYDGSARLNGANGFRSGRQKGAESTISSPNLTAKLEYFGLRGLNLGLSGYFGKTQSSLYNKLDKQDAAALATADSSVVGINMIGLDARYTLKHWQFRGQLYYASVNNTAAYNQFAASDLGSALNGYYVEAAYDLLGNSDQQAGLIPFVRYEAYNTQAKTAGGLSPAEANEVQAITTGLTWRLVQGAVFKTDIQLVKPASADAYSTTFNAGFGIMF
ncbi:MAG: hypothetical protein KJ578_03940 [Bacteroidetes bacterium]|nr:hypothetical protein [Bacteroidota bacterium]MBU1579859.1 hypothetical protein [Bacteroidota bacterium]MBU2556912.1 hypothetical protein [Bacteroidota bacterium]